MVESISICNQVINDMGSYRRARRDIEGNPSRAGWGLKSIRRRSRVGRFIYKEKKRIRAFEFLKMLSVIKHFKRWTTGKKIRRGTSFRTVESPKGEFGVSMMSDGTGIPHRCKIKSPSFYNLNLLSRIAKGHYLADLVALIGTIDIVFGEVDR